MIVRWAPKEHLPWLAQRAKIWINPALVALEAVEGTEIVGMMGYDGFQGNSCMMHVAVDHPMALFRLLKPALTKVFAPPPHGVGYAAVVCPVLEDNKASQRLVEGLGFRRIHFGKDWIAPGLGMFLYEMRREECRFIRPERKAA